MKRSDTSRFQTSQHRQCDIRLENDVKDLEAAASNRFKVHVKRFGTRPQHIQLSFPEVRTAFLNRPAGGEVEVLPCLVTAEIYPNAGNQFPYPLGSPVVKIFYPGLKWDLVPWLGGLLWLKDKPPEKEPPSSLPAGLQELVDSALSRSYPEGIGLPCLWREGEWNRNCDLLFTARQIHRLLTDPRDYSPEDSLNPEAALYWASHRDQLPLEPPIPELVRNAGSGFSSRRAGDTENFSLTEVS